MRSPTGALVPLGTLVEIRDVDRTLCVQRYNMYLSVPLQGNAAPGRFDGRGADDDGEPGRRDAAATASAIEWTELAYQERQAGNTAVLIFAAVGAVRVPGAGGAV